MTEVGERPKPFGVLRMRKFCSDCFHFLSTIEAEREARGGVAEGQARREGGKYFLQERAARGLVSLPVGPKAYVHLWARM